MLCWENWFEHLVNEFMNRRCWQSRYYV